MIPTTIKELKEILTKNCFNEELYSIDGNTIYEGFGLEKWGELFIWFYTERGNKENLKYFRLEEEAVKYAFDKITADKYANSHLIKSTDIPKMKDDILKELEFRKINFWMEEIPLLDNKLYRIFVKGCDVNKVKDLITNENI
ncbi:hypothetical protein [Chryseobacterium tongliaoense]|uniref:hypothetical protein n=1 Tax=Chryseobacterium tongliaoense TaxID=3240933 RepID=UPI0035155534